MAFLKNSVVAGDLRVTGTIHGDANLSSINANNTGLGTDGQILKSTGTGIVWSDANISGNATNVTGIVAVANGGTGTNTLESGKLLIGNGTNAVGTRTIKNMITAGNLGWTAAGTDIYIPTVNTLAYWNGRYNASSSNLAYCNKGAFGTAATYNVATAGTKDTWGLIPVIGGSDGVMEVGKYIDFHTTDGNTADYDVRITAATTGLTISGTTSGTFSGNLAGTASKATADADGNTISSTYVKKAGDTMTGALNIKKTDSNVSLATDSSLKIGTARYNLNFDINNGSGTGVNDGYAGAITWGSGTSSYAGIYYQSSGNYGSRLIFGTTNSYANGAYARMIIQSNGYVGIGTLSPDVKLHVNGASKFTDRLTMVSGKPINQILTGTGTAATAVDAGASANPRYTYKPARWTFNTGLTATDGDIYTIKIPVAGHTYGVFMTIDNGSHYYPVVANGTGRITTHYGVGNYIQVIFEANGSAAGMASDTIDGTAANSQPSITVTGGVFRVINYYDSGNSNDTSSMYIRYAYGQWKPTTALYRYMICLTKDETQVIPLNTTSNSTANNKTTITTDSFNVFMPIWYYSTTSTVNAGTAIGASYLWSAYNLVDLRYSFNLASGTSTFTAHKDIYIKAVMQDAIHAKLDTATPLVQTLPASDDGFVYIKLGHMYDGYRVTITYDHPVYIYKNGAVRLYSGYATNIDWADINGKPSQATAWPNWSQIQQSGAEDISEGSSDVTDNTEIFTSYASNNGFADTHAKGVVYRRDAIHVYNYIKGKTDNLYAPKSHAHGNITNAGELSTASRAVVTDANKKITVADLTVSEPSASGSGITYIATISQNSQGKISATKSTVRDASTSQSGVVSTAAQSFAGLKTFNGGITAGTSSAASSSSHSLWSTGITVHDTRYDSIEVTSLSKAANLFFSNKEMPNTNWWAGVHIAGWTGDYSAWELVGPSHNTDQRTTPLYVRSGRTTNGWGSWRKIYDTSNKPSISDHSVTTPTGATSRTADVALNTTTVNSITAVGTLPSLTVTATDVVTGGTTTAIPNISKKTVVTGVTKKTVVTGGSTTAVPNISKKTVVTSATAAKATYSSGVLTISDGSVTTGDSVTVGTAINAYTSLTTGDSVTVTTGDSVTVGTAINAYTALTTSSIGSASGWSAGTLPTKGSNTTVATSIKTQPTFSVTTQTTTLSHTVS